MSQKFYTTRNGFNPNLKSMEHYQRCQGPWPCYWVVHPFWNIAWLGRETQQALDTSYCQEVGNKNIVTSYRSTCFLVQSSFFLARNEQFLRKMPLLSVNRLFHIEMRILSGYLYELMNRRTRMRNFVFLGRRGVFEKIVKRRSGWSCQLPSTYD